MYTGPTIIRNGLQCYFDADNTKSYNPSNINDTNLLDIGTWMGGNSITSSYFTLNGTPDETNKYISNDPFGEKTLIWESNGTGTNNADGGWNNGEAYNVDTTKTHRFSTWVHRSVLGNGNFYLGLYIRNSSSSLLSGIIKTNGFTGSTNAYFWIDNGSNINSDWTLIVAHLWPIGSSAGAIHTDTGRYTISGGKISSSGFIDFIMPDTTATLTHRSYLFYSTIIPTQQRWCYPRIDVCDGTEPSIADLLNGLPNSKQFQINDLSGNNSFINLGNRLNIQDNSFRLNNSTLKSDFINTSVNGSTSGTLSFEIVIKRDNKTKRDVFVAFQKDIKNSYTILELAIDANDSGLIVYRGDGSTYSSGGVNFSSLVGYSSTNYNIYTVTVNGSVIKIYVNGTLLYTWTYAAYSDFDKILIGTRYNTLTERVIGNVKSFKYFDRELSSDEIIQNYNATKSRFSL